jgi:hypothetical protein
MVKKFSEFIFESNGLELHYYAFDWDDNILHMPTVIHMDKKVGDEWQPVDVSTSDFAEVRNDKENYRLRNNNPSESFSEFRDEGPRGGDAFLLDTKKALSQNQIGPSWDAFIECLREGSLFAIITARGHEPETIRKSVEYIIDNVLSEEDRFLLYSNCLKHAYIFAHEEEFDRIPKGTLTQTPLIKTYLDECSYYGVSSNSFASEFGGGSASNPEKAKELALQKFIDKCNQLGKKVGAKSVSIGFSDDDPKNVEHVRTYFKERSALENELMPHDVKFNLYKTTDRKLKGGERTKFHPVEEAADSSIAPGMQTSVMAFSQFNNMKDRMFTDPNEYDKSMELGTKQLAKMSKENTKSISNRRKKKIKK